MDIVNIIIYIAAATEVIMGTVVFFSNPRHRINRLFLLLTLVTAYWIITNPFMAFEPSGFWVKNSYAAGILIPPLTLIWTIGFTTREKVKWWLSALITLPAIIFFFATYYTDFIIERVDRNFVGGFEGQFGPLFPLFSIYAVSLIACIFYLVTKSFYLNRGIERIQSAFIALGLFGFGIVTATVSFILPVFGIDKLIPLDSPSSVFFIAAVSYAILRHGLFNVKVIATELITFTLWLFILVRVILAETFRDTVIESSLLIVSIIVGILLIRSVMKEVSQRERIETLAKDLEMTNKDLESANVRLKELDKLKSEFVSLASHQMRGPITAIKGYASLLIEGMYGKLDDKVKEAVGVIFESSASMAVIVDDFLNLTKIEQGKMSYDFTLLDICSVADEVSKEIRPVVEKKGLKFIYTCHSDGMHNAVADKGKIRQVMMNLIDNAIKYTPKGSITLEIKKETHEGHLKISIIVSDTGVGLSADAMPKLFQKFARAKNANDANVLGTGLGLYVVRQMVEAHKGTVRVESEGENKGSKFIVEIPGA